MGGALPDRPVRRRSPCRLPRTLRAHRMPAAAGLVVGLGAYSGFAAQVPVSAGVGPTALGVFSSVIAAGGAYVGLLHERSRRLPEGDGSGGPVSRVLVVTFHPADASHAEWVAAALSSAAHTRVETRSWGAFSALSGTDDEAWEIMVISSTSRIVTESDGTEHGCPESPRSRDRLVAVCVDAWAEPSLPEARQTIELDGQQEGAAYTTLMHGLTACGALDIGDWPPQPEPLPSGRGVMFPGDGARVTNLPPPDPAFLGRDDLTRLIRAGLVQEHGPDQASAVALWGLGGVGKSAVAAHYAHRFGGNYEIVWWLNAESPAELRHGLLMLAAELGVGEQADTDRMLVELWRVLRGRRRWLLIYDNADADAVPGTGPVQHWPTGRDGHVLFTSARSDWGGLIDPSLCLEVRPMTEDTAVRLLCAGAADNDRDSARAISQLLGGLPLALAHAAAYCRQAAVPLRDYQLLLDNSFSSVLARFRPDDRMQPVAMTWSLLLTRAGEQMPETLDLVRLWAMLAPVRIPRDLLAPPAPGTAANPPPPRRMPGGLAELADDSVSYHLAVRRLARYSLISVEAEHVHVHRLVQAVVRLDLGHAAVKWLEAAAVLLTDRFPRDVQDNARWRDCAELLPHVLALQARYREQSRTMETSYGDAESGLDLAWASVEELLGELLSRAGHYLIERSVYGEAREPIETALALRERVHGRRSPQWAETALWHSVLLYRLADITAARAVVDAALRVREETAGPEAPLLCPFLVWRCRILVEFSELEEAWRSAERALQILESARIPRDDDRRVQIDDLRCTVLWRRGDFRHALRLMEQTVAVLRAAHGEGNDRTLVALGRMAFIESELGSLLGDRAMLYRARARVTEATATLARRYGDDHFEVMEQRRTLAAVLCGLGEFASAERLLRRAAVAYRETLGAHPSTVAAEKLHAVALARLGEFEAADEIMCRSRAFYENLYGPGHPYVAEVLVEHGPILAAHGDVDAAARHLRRARRIYEERYGRRHPKLITVLTGLAALAGSPEEAAGLREQVGRMRDRL